MSLKTDLLHPKNNLSYLNMSVGEMCIRDSTYAGQDVAVTETVTSFYNERQKVKISLEKVLEQNDTFGIGTNDAGNGFPVVKHGRLAGHKVVGGKTRRSFNLLLGGAGSCLLYTSRCV